MSTTLFDTVCLRSARPAKSATATGGYVVQGNGGPRWLRLNPKMSDRDAMPVTEDAMVRHAMSGIITGVCTYSGMALGRTAEAMSAQGGTTLSVTRTLSDRMVVSDEAGAALTYRTEPKSWYVLSLRRQPTPLLRILALAMPSLPVAWEDGLWWSGTIPAGHLRSGPAGWLRRLRCTSHFMPWDADVLTLSTHLRGFHPGLPLSARARIDPARGLVGLSAEFVDGSLRFERVDAQLDSPTP